MSYISVPKIQAPQRSARRSRAATQRADGGVIINTPDDLARYLKSGSLTESGALVTPDTAMRNATAFACGRIISGAVANMPLQIKRRIDDRTREDATDHPLWQLLTRKPNDWMTPSAFRRLMTMHVLFRGNAYALKARAADGRVLSLTPMDPDRVRVEHGQDDTIDYVYQRRSGGEIRLAQRDVFHLVGLTLDGILGVSVISYARETIGMALTTERHGSTMFRNGTHLGGMLEHPGELSAEAYERLKTSLEDYRGAENAGKNLILEEGMKFSKLGMTSEDAQYIETRKFSRTDIAMFFGVPPHMIGDTEKSTSWGTGIEQQSLGFVAYTLEDWLTTWEQTIARDLIGNDPTLYARFNRAALVRGDIKTRWEAHVKALQWGVASPNEVRATEDMNPREGGDIYYPPPNTAGGGSNEPEDPSGTP